MTIDFPEHIVPTPCERRTQSVTFLPEDTGDRHGAIRVEITIPADWTPTTLSNWNKVRDNGKIDV